MNIKGLSGMNVVQIQDEVTAGGRFVRFPFCISLLVISFRQSSAVYFLKRGESGVVKGWPFTLISLLFGWWGIPFGIVYTVSSLLTNLGGGKDVTDEMMAVLHRHTDGHVFEFEKIPNLTQQN